MRPGRGLVWDFLAYKKNLGRIETRTRDKKYLGRIRSVRAIPEAIEPELRTALCERRQTDRLKTNYSIDTCTSMLAIVKTDLLTTSIQTPMVGKDQEVAPWVDSIKHDLHYVGLNTTNCCPGGF